MNPQEMVTRLECHRLALRQRERELEPQQIGNRRYLVPVRNFDGPDELVPAHHVRSDGVITDRRALQWFPYPQFEPPRATALLIALDDPDFPDEYVLEFGEYTNCLREGGGWILIGSDAPDDPVRYFARVGNLPRSLPKP